MFRPGVANPFTDEQVDAHPRTAPSVLSHSTLAEKQHRSEVRKEISKLLMQGGLHRQNLLGILHLYRDGFWTDDEMLTHLFSESNEVTKWQIEVGRCVTRNFGEERAMWMTAPIRVTDYPDTSPFKKLNISFSPEGLSDGLRRNWEALTSRMAKLEQLLNEYPEL
ncbi:MAG TPA: hypothetical protein VGA84_15035 [Thermoanaerobaculia bacterium]